MCCARAPTGALAVGNIIIYQCGRRVAMVAAAVVDIITHVFGSKWVRVWQLYYASLIRSLPN